MILDAKDNTNKYFDLIVASETRHIQKLISPDISILDLALSDLRTIKSFKDNFIETGNPLFALDAFTFAHRRCLEVPTWVRSWLYSSFCRYKESDGEEGLEKLLGFKRRNYDVFKVLKQEEIYREAFHGVALLRQVIGISTLEAATIYCNSNTTSFSVGSLIQYYERDDRCTPAKFWKEEDLVSGWFGLDPDPLDMIEFVLEKLPKDEAVRERLRRLLVPLTSRAFAPISGRDLTQEQAMEFLRKRIPPVKL